MTSPCADQSSMSHRRHTIAAAGRAPARRNGKLMKYIREHNKQPKTVKWKYFDLSRRITLEAAVTSH
jgi:hypothetical protein